MNSNSRKIKDGPQDDIQTSTPLPATAKGGLGILVKIPGKTPLTLPLTKTLEPEQSTRFHELMVALVEGAAKEAHTELGITPYWIVTSEEDSAHPLLKSFEKVVIEASASDGEMYCRSYEKIRERHGFALVMSSDTPQLGLIHLKKACDLAKAGEFVVGPTEGGSTYLSGGSQAILPEVWGAIPFGTSVAEKAIHRLFTHFGKVSNSIKLYDLQNVEDLQSMEFDFASQMHQFGKESLTPEQKNAFDWIKQLKAGRSFGF